MTTSAAIASHIHNLRTYMGELLGPKPVLEIVITHYVDDKINFQFEGMGKPADPEHVFKLLAIVAKEVQRQIPQETPSE